MPLRAPFAFLFDMDGVIIDSTNTHTLAWQEYLKRHGIEQPYIAERMLGRHNDEIVAEFFGTGLDPESVVQHGAAKEALYRELMLPQLNAKLVPGAVEFLREWAEVPKAVASNAEPQNVEFVLREAGLADCFDHVLSGNDVERPKPAPDVYLEAAERLGGEPKQCIVFEDSPAGVEAGRRAGMRVVAVLTTVPHFDTVELAIDHFRDPRLKAWLSMAHISTDGTGSTSYPVTTSL